MVVCVAGDPSGGDRIPKAELAPEGGGGDLGFRGAGMASSATMTPKEGWGWPWACAGATVAGTVCGVLGTTGMDIGEAVGDGDEGLPWRDRRSGAGINSGCCSTGRGGSSTAGVAGPLSWTTVTAAAGASVSSASSMVGWRSCLAGGGVCTGSVVTGGVITGGAITGGDCVGGVGVGELTAVRNAKGTSDRTAPAGLGVVKC